jgi:tetratricopeptide (TPR) repeat protein
MVALSRYIVILFNAVYTRHYSFRLAHELARQNLPVLLDTRSMREISPDHQSASWVAQFDRVIVVLSPAVLLDAAGQDSWLSRTLSQVLCGEKTVVTVLLHDATSEMLEKLDESLKCLLQMPVFTLNLLVDAIGEEIQPVASLFKSLEGESSNEPFPETLPPWLNLAEAAYPTREQLLAEADLDAAFVAFHAKDFPLAIELTGRAIRHNPSLVEAHKVRGDAQFQLNQFRAAIASYDQALSLNSLDYRFHHNRGLAFYRQDKFEHAIINFDRSLELNPDYFRGYAMRALAKFKLGRLDESILDNTQMIRLRPDEAVTYNNRASTRYTIGDFKGALLDVRRAIELDPEYVYAWDTLGQIQFVLGQLEEAVDALRHAVELRPDRLSFQAALAVAQYATGQVTEARERWQKLLNQEPRLNEPDYLSQHLHWQQPLLDAAARLIEQF